MTRTPTPPQAALRLRKWSTESKRTLASVCEAVPCSRPTLTSWLQGRTEPAVSKALRVQEITAGFVRVEHWAR